MLLFSCRAVTGRVYLSCALLAMACRHLLAHHSLLTVAWLLHSHAFVAAAECRKRDLV